MMYREIIAVCSETRMQARIYARAPGAQAQGGKFSGAAY